MGTAIVLSKLNKGGDDKYKGARNVGLCSQCRRVRNNDRDKETVALSEFRDAEGSYVVFPEVSEYGQTIDVADVCAGTLIIW
jgi:hypothetical protein